MSPPTSILGRARPLLAARLAGAALTFAVPLVLARVLLPASYGTFKQGWLLSQTLQLVLPMGLTQSLYYFLPREPAARHRYVAQTLWITLGLGVLSAVLLLAAGPLVGAHFENPELVRNLPWVAAFTAFTLAGAPLDVAWNAQGRIVSGALVRVATEAGRGGAMVAGALLTGTVTGAFAGIAVASFVRAAACAALLLRRHGHRFDRATLRRQAAYALPFGLAFLLIVPQQQYHHYAVAAAVSAAAFAVYSVGTFQLPLVDVLYTPVSELLQLGLAEQEGQGRPARAGLALFHEAVLQLSFAFVPLTGLLLVAGPDLVVLLFSARYAEAGDIFRVAVLSVALAALPLDGVMRARAQNRFMLALSAAKLALTLALVPAGLAALGPVGALLGWLVVEAAARAAMLVRAARLFEVPLARVLPARALGRQLVATAAAAPAAWLALHAVPGHLVVRLAACGLAFAAAYLGLSWARGWLPAGWATLFRARPAASGGVSVRRSPRRGGRARRPHWAALVLGAALAAVTVLRLPAAWASGNALNHVSGAWMALADDLVHGTFYRAPFDPALGFGGTRVFPLTFALHAALVRAGLPLLPAGQLLSAAAGVLLALAALRFLRRAGHRPLAAAALSPLVLAGFAGQHALAAVRGDLLAAALALWGLAALAPRGRSGRRDLAGAAGGGGSRRAGLPSTPFGLGPSPGVGGAADGWRPPLEPAAALTLAFAAKPTALAAALAGVTFLALRGERRRALALGALVAAGCAAVLAATDLLSGGRFLPMLAELGPGGAGPASLLRAPVRLADLLLRVDRQGLAVLAAAALAAWFTYRDGRARAGPPGARALAALWLGATGLAALGVLASPGTGVNHLVELEAAGGLLAAACAAGAPAPRRTTPGGRALQAAAALAAVAGLGAAGLLWREDLGPSRLGALRRATAAAAAGAPAPVLSEDPLLPLCAGERAQAVDAWMLRLAAGRDPAVAAPLLAGLRDGAYRAVVLLHDPRAPDAAAWFSGNMGEAALAEIRRSWREVFVAEPYRVYRYAPPPGSRRQEETNRRTR